MFMQRTLALLTICLSMAASAGARTLEVFVAPSGNDGSAGTSQSSPVRTLKQALRIAQTQASSIDGDILIQFLPGDYVGDYMEVDWFPQGRQKLILDGKTNAGSARFNGQSKGTTWLVVRGQRERPTNLVVREFQVRDYRGAIAFYGDRFDRAPWSSGTNIEDNVFENIGQFSEGVKPAFAAITFTNSHSNTVVGNKFKNIRNLEACDGLHAIYLSGGSSGNRILGNTFEGGCGDTIKARDRANFNVVSNNSFLQQEGKSLFVDSFCDKRKRSECAEKQQECPSWGNQFTGNTVDETSKRRIKYVTRTVGANQISQCPLPTNTLGRILSDR